MPCASWFWCRPARGARPARRARKARRYGGPVRLRFTNPSAVCAPLSSPSAWQVLRGAAARLSAGDRERVGAAAEERAGAAAEALAAVVHAHARNHADAVRRGAPQVLQPDGLKAGPCARAALWNVDEALWNVDEASSTFCGKLTRSRAVAAGAWVHARSGARASARGARGDAGGTARPDAPAPALSLSVSLTSFGMGNHLSDLLRFGKPSLSDLFQYGKPQLLI